MTHRGIANALVVARRRLFPDICMVLGFIANERAAVSTRMLRGIRRLTGPCR